MATPAEIEAQRRLAESVRQARAAGIPESQIFGASEFPLASSPVGVGQVPMAEVLLPPGGTGGGHGMPPPESFQPYQGEKPALPFVQQTLEALSNPTELLRSGAEGLQGFRDYTGDMLQRYLPGMSGDVFGALARPDLVGLAGLVMGGGGAEPPPEQPPQPGSFLDANFGATAPQPQRTPYQPPSWKSPLYSLDDSPLDPLSPPDYSAGDVAFEASKVELPEREEGGRLEAILGALAQAGYSARDPIGSNLMRLGLAALAGDAEYTERLRQEAIQEAGLDAQYQGRLADREDRKAESEARLAEKNLEIEDRNRDRRNQNVEFKQKQTAPQNIGYGVMGVPSVEGDEVAYQGIPVTPQGQLIAQVLGGRSGGMENLAPEPEPGKVIQHLVQRKPEILQALQSQMTPEIQAAIQSLGMGQNSGVQMNLLAGILMRSQPELWKQAVREVQQKSLTESLRK